LSWRGWIDLHGHLQTLPALRAEEETLIGGQAVIEGVMMRAPHSYCVAVRKPSGEIITHEKPLPKVSEKYPLFRFPILRGVGNLGQMLVVGIKALQFSANAGLEEAAARKSGKGKEISGWMLALNLLISLGFFIFLYKFVPLYLTTALGWWAPAFQGRIAFNLVDGLIRIAIFVGFLYLISRWKEIGRVFEYHGAEHRVVFNFESGEPVTVQNAQAFPTFHPRCGTSFLLVVMVVSIALYTLLPFEAFIWKLVGRVLLLPLIAGLSFEAIRFAARHRGGLLATLTAPGLWLQRITTRPPTEDQTAVAIHALEGAMALEKTQGGQPVIA
jgi:uncharacterized protein YqhQ